MRVVNLNSFVSSRPGRRLAALGLSDKKYNSLRLSLGTENCGMASNHALRSARAAMARSPAAAVQIDESGAHI